MCLCFITIILIGIHDRNYDDVIASHLFAIHNLFVFWSTKKRWNTQWRNLLGGRVKSECSPNSTVCAGRECTEILVDSRVILPVVHALQIAWDLPKHCIKSHLLVDLQCWSAILLGWTHSVTLLNAITIVLYGVLQPIACPSNWLNQTTSMHYKCTDNKQRSTETCHHFQQGSNLN